MPPRVGHLLNDVPLVSWKCRKSLRKPSRSFEYVAWSLPRNSAIATKRGVPKLLREFVPHRRAIDGIQKSADSVHLPHLGMLSVSVSSGSRLPALASATLHSLRAQIHRERCTRRLTVIGGRKNEINSRDATIFVKEKPFFLQKFGPRARLR